MYMQPEDLKIGCYYTHAGLTVKYTGPEENRHVFVVVSGKLAGGIFKLRPGMVARSVGESSFQSAA